MKAGFSFWLGLAACRADLLFCGHCTWAFRLCECRPFTSRLPRLGFNTAVWLVMRNEEWLTGGTFGINNIARPSLFGYSLEGNLAYYYFVLVHHHRCWAPCNGACCAALGQGVYCAAGQPDPAESLGIDTRSYTLLSFAIRRCRTAGVAGALFASLVQFIEPAPFTVGASIMMYLMVVVGGPG